MRGDPLDPFIRKLLYGDDKPNGDGHADDWPDDHRGDAWEPPPGGDGPRAGSDPEPETHKDPGDHGLDDLPGGKLDEADAAELAAAGGELHLDYLPFLGEDGYVVKGWSHLIAGYPRTGKTELVTACCRDWLERGERILYLTEEPRVIWQARLARAPDVWGGMRLVFGLGANPLDLLVRAKRGAETIVIADAIRNLGLVGPDENDNTALARHLAPWVKMARDGHKTLALLHHDRKGGGEHGQAIAGRHALLGAVDIALELVYDRAPSRRLIRAKARIIQPAEMMYERHEDGTLHALGSPERVSLAEVRQRVLEVVGEDWQKTKDIREALDEPRPSLPLVREALALEGQAGTVEREPPLAEGALAGRTHRWRRRLS
jgi:DNA repair protein RadA/Sms